jgi:hypothetical protein
MDGRPSAQARLLYRMLDKEAVDGTLGFEKCVELSAALSMHYGPRDMQELVAHGWAVPHEGGWRLLRDAA